MEKRIRFSKHALGRLEQRSKEFNICFSALSELVKQTIIRKCPAKRHLSSKYETYCCYFDSALNITLYVICEECRYKNKMFIDVRTIIVENGRT